MKITHSETRESERGLMMRWREFSRGGDRAALDVVLENVGEATGRRKAIQRSPS